MDYLKNITIEYEDENYGLIIFDDVNRQVWPEPSSRYYLPKFYGLALMNVSYPQNRQLFFGEFDATMNQNIKFAIFWSEGSQSEVNFVHSVQWKPTKMSSSLIVDGKEMPFGPIRHVVP